MTYTEPLMLVVVVWVLVGILLRRKWLAFSGVVGLVLITLPAAEWVFSRPLEGTYPVRPFVQPADVEAIVVFSGGVEPPEYERPYAEARNILTAFMFRRPAISDSSSTFTTGC